VLLATGFYKWTCYSEDNQSSGGAQMPIYLDLVILLNFSVDFLLLLGTNRLCGHPPKPGRAAIAATLGGLYGGACLLPGLTFLGNIIWRFVFLALMSVIAFGISLNALRRGMVFTFLSMALGGIALGVGGGGFWGVILPACGLFILCRIGFSGNIGGRKLMPVELECEGRIIRFTALQDTGNALKDPLTGKPVLVVAAEIAKELTGLEREQLKNPVALVSDFPGLRLIPYHTVGTDNGFLVARRFANVRIGKQRGSALVAFAPMGLSRDGEYQALTGGIV